MPTEPHTILYCGSFNPIHKGHIALAEEVLNRYPQCDLWLVVSPQNPLKQRTDLAPEEHRPHCGATCYLCLSDSGLRHRISSTQALGYHPHTACTRNSLS